MNVRNAGLDDVDVILELLNSSKYLQSHSDYKYTREFVEVSLNNPIYVVIVSEIDEKVVGVIIGEILEDHMSGFIVDLVVSSDFRGVGVGKSLYERYEELCNKKGVKKIEYLVNTSNDQMQKWSEKQGFEKGNTFYFYTKKLE